MYVCVYMFVRECKCVWGVYVCIKVYVWGGLRLILDIVYRFVLFCFLYRIFWEREGKGKLVNNREYIEYDLKIN